MNTQLPISMNHTTRRSVRILRSSVAVLVLGAVLGGVAACEGDNLWRPEPEEEFSPSPVQDGSETSAQSPDSRGE
jgi:hypothetical protein